jgi:hypothetical protein
VDKPSLQVSEPYYDYHAVIDYIEDKYKIKTRDYHNSHNHFDTWLKIVGEEKPVYPTTPHMVRQVLIDGVQTEISEEEYTRRFKIIHDQYARYKAWEELNPCPPYLDFWHWLVEGPASEVHNGSYFYMNPRKLIKEGHQDWICEILELINKEFAQDYDNINFWVEW